MAQQLNLLAARFAPQPQRFSARQGALAMLAMLVASGMAAGGLRWAAARAADDSRDIERQMVPLRAQRQALDENTADHSPAGSSETGRAKPRTSASGAVLSGRSVPALELAQLRAMEAGQRRISAALNAGIAGASEGHAEYLEALARRASPTLWITGFSMADDGSSIELAGRMTDASAITDYLRSLNAEPRFKGRPFAQLSLKSIETPGAGSAYTEFLLLSKPTNSSTNSSTNPSTNPSSNSPPNSATSAALNPGANPP